MYLRALRTIMNIAIGDGVIKREMYPFGKRKYQIPMCSPKDKARDYWMFSYLANGMNFKDICKLKFSNVYNDSIVFHRSKMVNTRRSNPIQIIAIITNDMQRIIDKWGNNDKSAG